MSQPNSFAPPPTSQQQQQDAASAASRLQPPYTQAASHVPNYGGGFAEPSPFFNLGNMSSEMLKSMSSESFPQLPSFDARWLSTFTNLSATPLTNTMSFMVGNSPASRLSVPTAFRALPVNPSAVNPMQLSMFPTTTLPGHQPQVPTNLLNHPNPMQFNQLNQLVSPASTSTSLPPMNYTSLRSAPGMNPQMFMLGNPRAPPLSLSDQYALAAASAAKSFPSSFSTLAGMTSGTLPSILDIQSSALLDTAASLPLVEGPRVQASVMKPTQNNNNTNTNTTALNPHAIAASGATTLRKGQPQTLSKTPRPGRSAGSLSAISSTSNSSLSSNAPSDSPGSRVRGSNSKSVVANSSSGDEKEDDSQSVDTAEANFRCSNCGSGFKNRGGLTRHMRIHTGEKPYVCTICHKRFNQKGHLTIHLRSHSGETPFQCDDCEKRFKTRSDMKRHIRVHTGEKPFSCPSCSRAFTRKTGLKKHTCTVAESS